MSNKAKILIVDDDHDYVETMRLILEERNYRVDAAYTINEAEQKLTELKPDIIILDIMMERINDGFKLCYNLKHDARYRDIPVLAVSSVNSKSGFTFSPETDGEYFEADDFLEKPVVPKLLLDRINALLQREIHENCHTA